MNNSDPYIRFMNKYLYIQQNNRFVNKTLPRFNMKPYIYVYFRQNIEQKDN